MFLMLRGKMQHTIYSELDNIDETNSDVADITSLSSCMVRDKILENDVTHLFNEIVELLLQRLYFDTFCNTLLYFYYATGLDGLHLLKRKPLYEWNAEIVSFVMILLCLLFYVSYFYFCRMGYFMTFFMYITEYLWILRICYLAKLLC